MKSRIPDVFTFLQRDFTVEKIMVGIAKLKFGSTTDECKDISMQFEDYDVIPLSQKNIIMGYWDTRVEKIVPLTPKDLITNTTNIFQLFDLFEKRQFFFVMESTQIIGFVHKSDLNNNLFKIPFYVLLQSLESYLLTKIDLSPKAISTIANKERVDSLIASHDKMRTKDIHLDSIQGLYLSEILELSLKQGVITIHQSLKHNLEQFRNRVSHADKSLIVSEKDIPKLKQVKDYCFSVLMSDGTASL